MQAYVVANDAGTIIQWGRCPEGDPALSYAPEGGANIAIDVDTYEAVRRNPAGYMVAAGAVVPRG